ncbi:hypothetical protein K431DRAFT_344556 [Polychaeton citri CBS 116435]|uniref:Uncharacterized protein n=1 Tax=Polychaeton citri CBS 116435 TaxID=1314669 RepID=A0A9P4UR89_9PEZI|nr:hypothetical protein K431DRAFT_344556 [Polychaeton citri CBS 116435]
MPSLQKGTSNASPPKVNGIIEGSTLTANERTPFGDLYAALESLRNTDSFRKLSSVHEQLGSLQRELCAKHKQIKSLEEADIKQKGSHQAAIEDLLAGYHSTKAKHDTDIELLRAQNKELEIRGREKDVECERLRQEKENALSSQADISDSLAHTRNKLEDKKREAGALEKKYNNSKKISNEMKESLEHQKKQVGRLQTELDLTKKDLESTSTKLSSTENELLNLNNMTVNLQEEDLKITTGRLQSLWSTGFQLVNKYFRADLTETSLHDEGLWMRLTSINENVPLPRSNSPAAKDIRCAVILAIIFYEIDRLIFLPTYLEEAEHLRPFLFSQARQDSHQEAFCRSALLSLSTIKQIRNGKERVDQLVSKFVDFVHGVYARGQDENLRGDFRKLVESAQTAWIAIRQLRPCYEPSMNPRHDRYDSWQTLSFQNGNSGVATASSNGDRTKSKAVLVVFPGLFVAKQNNALLSSKEESVPETVTRGIVFRESQTATAAEEVAQQEQSSPTRWTKSLTFGRRRDSNAAAPGFLGVT